MTRVSLLMMFGRLSYGALLHSGFVHLARLHSTDIPCEESSTVERCSLHAITRETDVWLTTEKYTEGTEVHVLTAPVKALSKMMFLPQAAQGKLKRSASR